MSEGDIPMRPTMNFRLFVPSKYRLKLTEDVIVSNADLAACRVLQQQFINTMTGQTEWRDVPIVEEA